MKKKRGKTSGAIPVSILTGFLGSGKTTVLGRLLRHPDMVNTLVIINEFGEIGLDHDLIERSEDDFILLQSGCLCCWIRGDLIATLDDIRTRLADGQIRHFDRVIIETTGLADPAPILHTLMADPAIATFYRLDSVISTVDAAVGNDTLDRHFESVKQVAVADRILLTKTDLAAPADIQALRNRISKINPSAPIVRSLQGIVDPTALFGAALYDLKTKTYDVQNWLNDAAFADPHTLHGHDHDGNGHHHDDDTSSAHRRGHDVNRHNDHIKAVCLTLDNPVDGHAFHRWLEAIFLLKGPDFLRVKGIINIDGLAGPLIIHGVQHIFHPWLVLKKWPSKDRRTRIVFITKDISEVDLRATLTMFTQTTFVAPAERSPVDFLRVDSGENDIAMFQVRLQGNGI